MPPHLVPHEPQLFGSTVAVVQPVLHWISPNGQVQTLFTQLAPVPHANDGPQPPQLFGSLVVSMHVPPQLVWFVLQQMPLSHA